MNRAFQMIHFTRRNKPADDWAKAKAAEMLKDGYPPGAIIAKLDAYGIGLYAAQALVRDVQ